MGKKKKQFIRCLHKNKEKLTNPLSSLPFSILVKHVSWLLLKQTCDNIWSSAMLAVTFCHCRKATSHGFTQSLNHWSTSKVRSEPFQIFMVKDTLLKLLRSWRTPWYLSLVKGRHPNTKSDTWWSLTGMSITSLHCAPRWSECIVVHCAGTDLVQLVHLMLP